MNRASILLGLTGLTLLGSALFSSATQQDPVAAEYKSKVQPLVKKYCLRCHTGQSAAGGFALDKGVDSKIVARDGRLWERFVFNVKSLSMPPSGEKPTEAERLLMIEWAQKALSSNCDLADAGRVTIRRLNRTEYDNTIRDLLGLDLKLSEEFPSDDVGEGFDNIGDVLTLSPLLLEKYLSAAEKAAAAAIKLPKRAESEIDLAKAEHGDGCRIDDDNGLVFFAGSTAISQIKPPEPGHYRLRIQAWQQKAGPENARIQVNLDGHPIDEFSVSALADKPQIFELPLELGKNVARIGLSFVNDYYNPQDPDPKNRDRNVFVKRLSLLRTGVGIKLPNGPITSLPQDTNDVETPRSILRTFATRAYRRPLRPGEDDRLLAVYLKLRKAKLSYEEAMRGCVTAILTSPNFLFREESVDGQGLLGGYEMANRLSYFLWGSMPDAELFQQASSGKLNSPKALEAQVARMLQLSKIRNLADNFAVQWLQLRKLDNVSPDPSLFPEFSDALRRDMSAEAQAAFMDVVNSDRSVLDLLASDSVYVNERLAQLYGIPGITGEQLRKVSSKERGGLLTMAGILTVTSNPNRTSPVKRGKWVLENILGAPPPPPMPNVGILIDDTAIKPTLPMKERLALHRKKPECATCHTTMDSIGFSLENYNPIGAWRTKDGDFAIDAQSTLPDGKKLKGQAGLRSFVLARKKDFVRCLAEKMLVFATGRGLRPQDSCHLTTIVNKVEKSGYKMHALIQAVVASEPFRKKSS